MTTAIDLYPTVKAMRHGHSGHGMTYWSVGAMCGRKARLSEQFKDKLEDVRRDEEDENDGSDGFAIGIFYHALMELDLQQKIPYDLEGTTDNENYNEAVRLFNGYRAAWGSSLRKWGARLLHTELILPFTEAVRKKAREVFGTDYGLTGRIDAVFDIPDVQIAYNNTGLLLPGPGLYLMDWKTGQSKSDRDPWEFTFGTQSIAYAALYNMEHPKAPALGLIYDKVVRHKDLRKFPEYHPSGKLKGNKSFWEFLAQPLPNDVEIIQALIKRSQRAIDANETNPAACFDRLKPCYFFSSGLCDRR
jgi:hypothetical protein